MWPILRSVGFLFLPWIIQTAIRYLLYGPKKSSPTIPRTSKDYVVLGILATLSLFYAYQSLLAVYPNFFREIGVPSDSQTFMIRNVLRAYLIRQSEQDSQWPSVLPDDLNIPLEETPLAYQMLCKIYSLLRTSSTRSMYNFHGQDTLLKCDYCSSETDYMMFSLIQSILSHCFMVLWIGIGTSIRRKAGWMNYALAALVILFCAETFEVALGAESDGFFSSWISLSVFDSQFVTPFEKRLRMRYGCFTLILIFLFSFDYVTVLSDAERIANALTLLKSINNRFHAIQLFRSSYLQDEKLRKHFFEYVKKFHNVRNAIMEDSEFQSKEEKILQKYNLQEMIKETEKLLNENNGQ